MISKNSRRATGSVEQLRQGSFTAVKGIDETAPALNTETVLRLKNLDVDTDGGLVLRKPLLASRVFPKVNSKPPVYIIPFQNEYTLLIYRDSSYYVIGIVDSNANAIPLDLEWVTYSTQLEKTVNSVNLEKCGANLITGLASGEFFKTSFFRFTDVTYANLATTLLLYGATVDYTHTVFENTLVDAELYSTEDTYIPRALQVTYNEHNLCAKVKIAYTELSEIQFGNDIPLDVNLSLDNPYAIRDSYAQSLCTVKGILPYLPAKDVDGKAVHSLAYSDASVERALDTTHTSYPEIPSDVPDAVFSAYRAGLSNHAPYYVSSYNPSELRVGFKSQSGNAFDFDSKIVRAGKLFCTLPENGLDIGFLWDNDGDFFEYDHYGLGTFRIKSYAFRNASYAPLCKVSSNVDNVDIISSTKTAPCVYSFNRNVLYCSIPLNIRYYNKDMEDYFTKDLKYDATLPTGTEKSVNVPEAISDFLNPVDWLVSADTDGFYKNLIPLCIALVCGFKQRDDSPYHKVFDSWKYSYNNEQVACVGRTITTEGYDSNTYIVLMGGVVDLLYGNVYERKALILRIPKISNGFQIGVSDFKIQGYPELQLKYTAGFGIDALPERVG